jgi:hypothetical protein
MGQRGLAAVIGCVLPLHLLAQADQDPTHSEQADTDRGQRDQLDERHDYSRQSSVII